MRRARIAGAEKFSPKSIFIRDGWQCGICRKPVSRRAKWPDPASASLDHIKPLSEGGEHSSANAQCSHLRCNSRKQAGAGGQYRLFG
jgi:5-methylcytosine-specific restriction endonuclease McrA